jgi:hypothetical protein
MRSFLHIASTIIVLSLAGSIAVGQSLFKTGDDQMAQLFARLDANSEDLRRSLVKAIETSFLNDAEIGKYMKDYAAEFVRMADRLKARSGDRKPIASEAQEILNRGSYLQVFMVSYDLGAEAERDWKKVSADLNQLAGYYKIQTNWELAKDLDKPGHPGILVSTPSGDKDMLSNRLIGTYKIEKSESGDAREEIERAVRQLPPDMRRRTLSRMLPRMRSPRMIAFDRKSDRVTLASSLQPVRVYTATGVAYGNRGPVERTMLYGGQFQLTQPDEVDTFYSVTYTTIDRGARLRVTNTVLSSQFTRPLIVVSYYKKISDTPRLNLDEEADVSSDSFGARRREQR